MGMKSFHVTFRKDDNVWHVISDGVSLFSAPRKHEALGEGRRLASEAKGSLRIHKRDGKIQDERTFGDDPHPPKG